MVSRITPEERVKYSKKELLSMELLRARIDHAEELREIRQKYNGTVIKDEAAIQLVKEVFNHPDMPQEAVLTYSTILKFIQELHPNIRMDKSVVAGAIRDLIADGWLDQKVGRSNGNLVGRPKSVAAIKKDNKLEQLKRKHFEYTFLLRHAKDKASWDQYAKITLFYESALYKQFDYIPEEHPYPWENEEPAA